jgi:DNA-directed RNA polymerase specialized sigma24 family protein
MELFRFGFHVLHDQGLADEMVQETFIKPYSEVFSVTVNPAFAT